MSNSDKPKAHESHVSIWMTRLEEARGDAQDIQKHMYEKLKPVIVAGPVNATAEKAQLEPLCPLAEDLRTCVYAFEVINREYKDLLARLEL